MRMISPLVTNPLSSNKSSNGSVLLQIKNPRIMMKTGWPGRRMTMNRTCLLKLTSLRANN